MADSDAQGRTAVLLIAHGSRHAPANDDLHQLAERFAARGDYPIVEASFLELADPDVPAGGDRCVSRGASRVLMVPYFLSAGVHLIRDLTAARDALRRRHPGVEFRLGPALGPHPLLDDLVSARIGQVDTDDSAPSVASSSELAERYAPTDGRTLGPAEAPTPGPSARSGRLDTIPSSD
jgi:sirohydrochlorin ferrochelatase